MLYQFRCCAVTAAQKDTVRHRQTADLLFRSAGNDLQIFRLKECFVLFQDFQRRRLIFHGIHRPKGTHPGAFDGYTPRSGTQIPDHRIRFQPQLGQHHRPDFLFGHRRTIPQKRTVRKQSQACRRFRVRIAHRRHTEFRIRTLCRLFRRAVPELLGGIGQIGADKDLRIRQPICQKRLGNFPWPLRPGTEEKCLSVFRHGIGNRPRTAFPSVDAANLCLLHGQPERRTQQL